MFVASPHFVSGSEVAVIPNRQRVLRPTILSKPGAINTALSTLTLTMANLSLSVVLAAVLFASASAIPFFGGRAKSAGHQNAVIFGIRQPSRGGSLRPQQMSSNDEESSPQISFDQDSEELAPIVDLISTTHRRRAPLTVPKIGAAAAVLYGVADVGSRIIVNTSGATAPVIMAAGAAGALVTGVWAGGMKQQEEKDSSLASTVPPLET